MEVDAAQDEQQMVSFHSVRLNTTQVHAVYATSPPMMTKINVGEAGMEYFECDTVASHNIMSQVVYDKLRSRKPSSIPMLK